ncbi:hypothetical protein ACWFRM_22740 [Streptomyces sp. NPDC055144]
MSRLVDGLFLLAKLGDSESGTPAAHREPVDLLFLAADTIATTAIRHPHRGITLEPLATHATSRDSDLDIIETPGDPHQLARVLANLLSNPCAHTRIHVRVGAARTPRRGGPRQRPTAAARRTGLCHRGRRQRP